MSPSRWLPAAKDSEFYPLCQAVGKREAGLGARRGGQGGGSSQLEQTLRKNGSPTTHRAFRCGPQRHGLCHKGPARGLGASFYSEDPVGGFGDGV